MILIFGGAYNGKLDFAKEKFNITDNDIFDFSCEICDFENMLNQVLKNFKCLYNTHYLLKNMPNVNSDYFKNYKGIIISDDLSCGIVPIEKSDRIYRETVSRFLTGISKEADEVYRIFLGIGTKIK